MTRFNRQRIQWSPVDSGFTPISQYNEFTGIVSDSVVWVPKNGFRIVLMGILLTTVGVNTLKLKGSVRGVFLTVPMNAVDNFDISPAQPIWVGEKDETLTFDASDANGSFVTLYGHEDS